MNFILINTSYKFHSLVRILNFTIHSSHFLWNIVQLQNPPFLRFAHFLGLFVLYFTSTLNAGAPMWFTFTWEKCGVNPALGARRPRFALRDGPDETGNGFVLSFATYCRSERTSYGRENEWVGECIGAFHCSIFNSFFHFDLFCSYSFLYTIFSITHFPKIYHSH